MTDLVQHDPAAGPALGLPAFEELTDSQVRGAVCVWGTEQLTAETAVDLGEQSGPDGRWWPRACRQHAADRASTLCTVDPAKRGTTLIPLAGMYPLMTDAQRQGRACPWCNTAVTREADIDLGVRELPMVGSIRPVACRGCTNEQARKAYAHHRRICTPCLRSDYCPTALKLRRLALETRR
jgi:hypothetical protein